jgi:hypothetical protein
MKTSCLDNRRFNTPPPPNNAIKRFNKTVSARVEASLLFELESLLKRRYGAKNVPMAKVSFIIRAAILRKIRELKDWEK